MNKVIVYTYINKATQDRRCIDFLRNKWVDLGDRNTYLNFPKASEEDVEAVRHQFPLTTEKYHAEFIQFSTWGDEGEVSPCAILRTSDGQVHVEDATCIVFTGA